MTIQELLLKEEGFVPHAYQDHLGYWTIGIGRLIDKRRGGKISLDEAKFLLQNDIDDKEVDLDETLPWWRDLDETRRTVLLSMAFQLGISGLLKFKKTLSAIRSQEWREAGIRMRRSLWYRQTPARAERMARAMETGRWDTP
jgi:lysozyme